MQLSLFDSPATQAKRARSTDPVTSHIAATEVNLPLAQQRALDASRVLLQNQVDVTANEVGEQAASMFGCRSETVRKRCHELVIAGRFAEGPPRKCSVTGKQCTTYKLKQ